MGLRTQAMMRERGKVDPQEEGMGDPNITCMQLEFGHRSKLEQEAGRTFQEDQTDRIPGTSWCIKKEF